MPCYRLLGFGILLLSMGLAACSDEPDPPVVDLPTLETAADSLAMELYEANGGPQAWAALPYLRFDFGTERDGERRIAARHLWDRHTDDYRLEWDAGEDSTYVALFNIQEYEEDGRGWVYLNGVTVDEEQQEELLSRAYRRFINDTYWLMAPVKLFDEGVHRSLVPDSADTETAVLQISFGDVGLTPDDRYWLYIDRETGRLDQWAFVLQGNSDTSPRYYNWTNYRTLQTSEGPVYVATRKEALDGSVTILTDAQDPPADLPASLFSDRNPRL